MRRGDPLRLVCELLRQNLKMRPSLHIHSSAICNASLPRSISYLNWVKVMTLRYDYSRQKMPTLENDFRTLPFHWMVGNRHETKEMCCFKLLLRSLQHPMFTQLTQSTVLAICYISVGYRAWCLRPRNSENARILSRLGKCTIGRER